MGLLDLISSIASSGSAPADASVHPGLLQHVLAVAGNSQTGGLAGLVDKLKAGGLASAVSSWNPGGTGQAVSADQIQAALGNAHIQELAAKFGMNPSDVASHLSQILPAVIGHLAPNGQVPEHGMVQSAIGLLKGRLLG